MSTLTLRGVQGEHKGKLFVLDRKESTIGSKAGAHIKFDHVDLLNAHAIITNGNVITPNGRVAINGNVINKATKLKLGDGVQIKAANGKVIHTFKVEQTSSAKPKPLAAVARKPAAKPSAARATSVKVDLAAELIPSAKGTGLVIGGEGRQNLPASGKVEAPVTVNTDVTVHTVHSAVFDTFNLMFINEQFDDETQADRVAKEELREKAKESGGLLESSLSYLVRNGARREDLQKVLELAGNFNIGHGDFLKTTRRTLIKSAQARLKAKSTDEGSLRDKEAAKRLLQFAKKLNASKLKIAHGKEGLWSEFKEDFKKLPFLPAVLKKGEVPHYSYLTELTARGEDVLFSKTVSSLCGGVFNSGMPVMHLKGTNGRRILSDAVRDHPIHAILGYLTKQSKRGVNFNTALRQANEIGLKVHADARLAKINQLFSEVKTLSQSVQQKLRKRGWWQQGKNAQHARKIQTSLDETLRGESAARIQAAQILNPNIIASDLRNFNSAINEWASVAAAARSKLRGDVHASFA